MLAGRDWRSLGGTSANQAAPSWSSLEALQRGKWSAVVSSHTTLAQALALGQAWARALS